MRQLIVKQLDYDLTPVGGLALVGHDLKALGAVLGRLDAALPVKAGVANSDIVRSYVGLLVQCKCRTRGARCLRKLAAGSIPATPLALVAALQSPSRDALRRADLGKRGWAYAEQHLGIDAIMDRCE